VRLCVQTDAAYRLQEGVCVFVRERERERERECMYVRARARGAAAPPRGRSGNTRARFICSCVDCFIEHQFWFKKNIYAETTSKMDKNKLGPKIVFCWSVFSALFTHTLNNMKHCLATGWAKLVLSKCADRYST